MKSKGGSNHHLLAGHDHTPMTGEPAPASSARSLPAAERREYRRGRLRQQPEKLAEERTYDS
ncbi:MAG: hypothetical protein ACM3N4_12725, partial [Nitrososphaerota archaeon]